MAALFAIRKSPTSSAFSIDPDVITNVWRRKLRMKRKSPAAISRDLVHSTKAFSGTSRSF